MGTRPTGEISAEVPVLTVQDAVVATFHEANRRGKPIKALADDTRIPGSRLYECLEHRKRLWAEEVPALVHATGNPLIVATIARACGGTFVPLPSGHATLPSDLLAATQAMEEFADTMRAFSKAIADGCVTAAEADRVTTEGHEAVTAILALIEHAQQRVHAGRTA
jgi:hypothetical protein